MTTSTTQHILQSHADLPVILRQAGAGRPVLILHGGAGPASVTAIIDHFAAAHHVLAPTHPGWDDTSRPDWFHSVGDLAVAYLALLGDLDLQDVTVLGSSFGGWVAAEMCLRDTTLRVANLILLDAIGPRVPGHEPTAPRPAPKPNAGGPTEQPPRERGPSPSAMAALQAYAGPTMQDPELMNRLAAVRIPTLVLWGENDPVVGPDFGRAYAAAFANARFELIPGAGHIPTQEAPEATFTAIDAFLAAT